MKHPTEIKKYDGAMDDLVTDIGNLRYDKLEEFLYELADKFQDDADADYEAGRKKLSGRLYGASKKMFEAAKQMEEACEISKSHMKE